MANIVNIDNLEITLPIPGKIVIPLGSSAGAWRIEQGYGVFRMSAEYDYEPFEDTEAPAFDFQADVVRVASNGEFSVEQNVTCQSLPGRRSVVQGE